MIFYYNKVTNNKTTELYRYISVLVPTQPDHWI